MMILTDIDIDILEFGTSKCAKAIFKIMSDHVRLDEETMIKDLEQQKVYRSNRGRGLTKIELSYKASKIGLFWYLNLSDDWMLRLSCKHEKQKGSHSVLKEARGFAWEIDLDLEIEFDG